MNNTQQELTFIYKISDFDNIIKNELGNPYILENYFSEQELADKNRRFFKRRIFSRLLIKKAITDIFHLNNNFFKEIEITNDSRGKPCLSVSKYFTEKINKDLIPQLAFSITHSKNYLGVYLIYNV